MTRWRHSRPAWLRCARDRSPPPSFFLLPPPFLNILPWYVFSSASPAPSLTSFLFCPLAPPHSPPTLSFPTSPPVSHAPPRPWDSPPSQPHRAQGCRVCALASSLQRGNGGSCRNPLRRIRNRFCPHPPFPPRRAPKRVLFFPPSKQATKGARDNRQWQRLTQPKVSPLPPPSFLAEDWDVGAGGGMLGLCRGGPGGNRECHGAAARAVVERRRRGGQGQLRRQRRRQWQRPLRRPRLPCRRVPVRVAAVNWAAATWAAGGGRGGGDTRRGGGRLLCKGEVCRVDKSEG